jgi:3-oxoacyl-[acyl-carrier protein] reductase
MTTGHTAIVTGANHGIGAATARALARQGCAVLCAYFRVIDPADPGIPQTYRDSRTSNAGPVLGEIISAGGRAIAMEADLSDPATPASLFDLAEQQLGPSSASPKRSPTELPRPPRSTTRCPPPWNSPGSA